MSLVVNEKLGYYVCDGIRFNGKIEACFYALKVKKPVKWMFNDDIFERYDWTREPDHSLDDLYKKRARELREKYDYIILAYSGGSDSHNVYQSFISQGLHIDEIFSTHLMGASEKFIHHNPNNFTNINAPDVEYKLHQVNRLKEIAIESPRTKISNFDLSQHVFKFLENNDESWVINQREGVNPLALTRFNTLNFSEVRKNLDHGKKIALITGIDKPQTFIRRGEFYIKFLDRTANINSIADHFALYDNCTVEYFYWAPESVDMLCKQGHIIKRWLELTPEKQEYWLESRVTKSVKRLVHEKLLKTVIYTTWNNSWYQADKSTSDWYSEFDNWFHQNFKNTTAYRNWNAGVDLLKNNLVPFLNHNRMGQPDGLKSISHNYCLGKIHLKPELASWFE